MGQELKYLCTERKGSILRGDFLPIYEYQ